jgi:hypothetical protein
VIVQIGGGEAGPQLIGLLSASSPTDCSFGNPLDVAEVIGGQIRIVDAPPLPTSADQCKKDGWRQFPGFKNQGDCVNFVVTGGKETPVG